jgi:hypothetical protein
MNTNTESDMMKFKYTYILVLIICLLAIKSIAQHRDHPISPVPFSSVLIEDDFWAPKIKTNYEVTIPLSYEQSLKSGRNWLN